MLARLFNEPTNNNMSQKHQNTRTSESSIVKPFNYGAIEKSLTK